jgi:hypothetical protein
MSVIPITLFFSLLLAGTFIALFAREHARRRFASAERDSLLPLADETPQPVTAPVAHAHEDAAHDHDDHDHDHDHAGGGCGCRDGTRPPCPGCLRRTAAPAARPVG